MKFWTFRRFRVGIVGLVVLLFTVRSGLGTVIAQSVPTATPNIDPGIARAVGTVSGRITNGTAASTVPPGVKVTLYDLDTPSTTEGSADASGNFTFPNVTIYQGHRYFVSATYRDNTFPSDAVTGDPAHPNLTLPITIYELTQDIAVLQIVGVDLQVTVANKGMQVLQKTIFRNTSDRLYTTNKALDAQRIISVVVALPPGAVVSGFSGSDQQRFFVPQDNSAVIDTVPVLPGADHTVQFTYFIPYDSGAIIEEPVFYQTKGDLHLWLSPLDVTATSAQFVAVGTETIGSTNYQRYDGKLSLQPNDVIRYELKGGGTPSVGATPIINSSNLPLVFVVMGGMVVLVALALIVTRRGSPADRLTRQIAELDAQHNAGHINHDLYRQRRQALQQRLDALTGSNSEHPPTS